MLRRSGPYLILGRLYGYVFIDNFGRKSLENAKVSWKAPYVFYSCCWSVAYLFFEALFVTRFTQLLGDITDSFSRTMLFIVHGVVSVKVMASCATFLTKPDKLLAFLRKSEAFERNTSFLPRAPSLRHSSVAHRWNAARAFVVFLGLALYGASGEHFIMELAQSMPAKFAVPVCIFTCFMASGFIFFDSSAYLILRSCTKVLVEYIQLQLDVLQKHSNQMNVHFEPNAASQIEAIRLRLNDIRKLKELLNDIWAESLIVACASTVTVDCVVLDAIVHDGIRKELWLAVAYSLYTSLSFIDMVYAGQTLIDETRKFKSATLMVPAFGVPDSYLLQLRYLHESVEPDGMCLIGGGFFRLWKPLLVSMTGAIIIFAIILVQTSKTVALKIIAT